MARCQTCRGEKRIWMRKPPPLYGLDLVDCPDCLGGIHSREVVKSKLPLRLTKSRGRKRWRLMLKKLALLVAVLCPVFFLCPLLYSQANGSLSGNVVDKTGSVIAGASVRIASQATGLTRETILARMPASTRQSETSERSSDGRGRRGAACDRFAYASLASGVAISGVLTAAPSAGVAKVFIA